MEHAKVEEGQSGQEKTERDTISVIFMKSYLLKSIGVIG